MGNARFEDLLGRLLDGELAPGQWEELIRLVREDPDRREEVRKQLEAAELIALSEDDLRDVSLFLAATRSRLDDDGFVSRFRSALAGRIGPETETETEIEPDRDRRGAGAATWGVRLPWALAVASLIALVATVAVLRPRDEPRVARIAELNGTMLWIGDGGRVTRDLAVGMVLPGGTLEALTADSWAVLRFRDGSAVTVSGPSMLTISELDHKELHLPEGTVFADVRPQAPGRPMLINTRTARLEVLGTQLNVEAEASATRLDVNKGLVRLTRLVDGSVAEVRADHQVVATADRAEALLPTRRPEAVDRWESDLMASMGKLLPAEDGRDARLKALPIVLNEPEKGTFAVYVAGFGASRCGMPPVRIEAGARFRVRGRLGSASNVLFKITTKKPEGAFNGEFEAVLPASRFRDGREEFEAEVELIDLRPQHPWLSGSPVGSVLENCSLLTVDVDAGLEVSKIELLPAPPA